MKISTPGTLAAATASPDRPVFNLKTNFTSSTEESALAKAAQVENLPPAQVPDEIKQEKEASEATKPLSPQFAALAKQRRELQREREAFEKEKAAKPVNGFDPAQLKANPVRWLLEQGLTYDDLTKSVLANQGNQEVIGLKQQIEELKTGFDKRFEERDTQTEQQVYKQIQSEAQALVASGEDYALVREEQAVPAVVELIKRTWNEEGRIMDTAEALKEVEDYLLDRQLKISNLDKIKSKLTEQQSPPRAPNNGMRTLTNKDTASAPMDRKTRAILAGLGQLAKGK